MIANAIKNKFGLSGFIYGKSNKFHSRAKQKSATWKPNSGEVFVMHGVIACWLAGCGGWLAGWTGCAGPAALAGSVDWLRWLAGLLAGLAALSALLGMYLSFFACIWVLGLVLGDTVGPSGPT